MASPEASSGGKKKRNPRKMKSSVTPLGFKETTGLPIGSLSLNKPSEVPGALKWEREVCLDLTDLNDAFSLRILREIHHPNILHIQSVLGEIEDSTLIKICVDAYTHSLDYCVRELNPSDLEVQSLVRQIIEGIHELILNDLYHGNFNIKTTYFDRSSRLIKLAEFQCRGDMVMEDAQYNDWKAVGTGLEEISSKLKKSRKTVDYAVLDDLASMLKNLSESRIFPPGFIKDQVVAHVFFWNETARSSFFIYGIQGPLQSNAFKQRVEELTFIPIDWNQDDHAGLLAEMNKYRTGKGLSEYKRGIFQYVKFVSGSYSHKHELQIQDIDTIITGRCPRLCLELVRIARELGFHV